ncbi:hypothetical protein RFI_33604, partial [Reticulomyxa filosa]
MNDKDDVKLGNAIDRDQDRDRDRDRDKNKKVKASYFRKSLLNNLIGIDPADDSDESSEQRFESNFAQNGKGFLTMADDMLVLSTSNTKSPISKFSRLRSRSLAEGLVSEDTNDVDT